MQHYSGIDLHSNNHVVVVIDEEDKRVFEKRLSNDLSQTLRVLFLYRESLQHQGLDSWDTSIDQTPGLCITSYTIFLDRSYPKQSEVVPQNWTSC